MNGLFDAAKEVCDFFASRGWSYCIIGGLAVEQWGEPRVTLDVDLALLTDWGAEEHYVSAILARFEPRIADAHDFAMRRRVLLVRAANGKDVDISLSALPFEAEMVGRAKPREFAPGLILPCCSAEDLFILKAFAARARDWVDAESIVSRQTSLDKAYILMHLSGLAELKEEPELLERAKQLLDPIP